MNDQLYTLLDVTRLPIGGWAKFLRTTGAIVGASENIPEWSKNSICLNPTMVAGRTGYRGKAFQNGSNTTLHGPQLTCNVFLAAVRRLRTSPMVSSRSSILTTRGFNILRFIYDQA